MEMTKPDFEASIDALSYDMPVDKLTLMAWADALAEEGHPAAVGMRWLADSRRWPKYGSGQWDWYRQGSEDLRSYALPLHGYGRWYVGYQKQGEVWMAAAMELSAVIARDGTVPDVGDPMKNCAHI